MKHIGVVGTRRRDSIRAFNAVLSKFLEIYKDGDVIVSGGCCKGGDRFAEIIADNFDIEKVIYPANWSLGRHAGFLRNTDIAKKADVLIACVSNDRTGGTEDTITKFKRFHGYHNIITC